MSEAYAVIGHPIGHTMSPYIHGALFALQGRSPEYRVLDIDPAQLESAARGQLAALTGYNITIPHKQAILPSLARLDDAAARYGAVNCVANTPEGAVGYNTDAYGFLEALTLAGIPKAGHVLLCGCGGVARTMAYELLLAGCTLTMAVLEMVLPDARKLQAELEAAIPGANIDIVLFGQFDTVDCDLLVNATPVGMFPKTDAMVVSQAQLAHTKAVFDAVYNPRETKLVASARAKGIPCGEGMAMLVLQAAKAHTYWYGATFTDAQIQQVIAGAYEEMERKFQ